MAVEVVEHSLVVDTGWEVASWVEAEGEAATAPRSEVEEGAVDFPRRPRARKRCSRC